MFQINSKHNEYEKERTKGKKERTQRLSETSLKILVTLLHIKSNWHFLNSTTTKHNMFQINSKHNEYETDEIKQLKVNTPNLAFYWNLYFEFLTKLIAFLSALIPNLEHVFVYEKMNRFNT